VSVGALLIAYHAPSPVCHYLYEGVAVPCDSETCSELEGVYRVSGNKLEVDKTKNLIKVKL